MVSDSRVSANWLFTATSVVVVVVVVAAAAAAVVVVFQACLLVRSVLKKNDTRI